MSVNSGLSNTTKEYYSQQVHDNYDATACAFKGMVQYKQEGVKGERILFEVMQALVGGKVGSAGTNSQNAKGGEIRQVWVYPEEFICEYYYRQLEFDQSGEYLKPKYAKRVVDAIRILEDIEISEIWNDDANFVNTAIDGTTSGTRIIGDGTAPLTFDLILQCKKLISEKAVNSTAKIYCIMDYNGETDLLKLDQFTNNDYISKYTLEKGTIDGLMHMGMHFKTVPNLADDLYEGYKHIVKGEFVFMLEDSIAFGTNSGLESFVERVADKQQSYLTQALANFDATVLHSDGLTKLKYDSDATVAGV